MAEFNMDKMAKKVAEKTMEELEGNGLFVRWIPVSERSPKKTGLYLVSIGDLVTTESFDGYDFRTRAFVRFVPDAWMPLPKPYM